LFRQESHTRLWIEALLHDKAFVIFEQQKPKQKSSSNTSLILISSKKPVARQPK
jgi:hypothetical protein